MGVRELFRIDRKGFFPPDAEIRETPGKGRGVFSTRKYARNELIERAPTFTFEDNMLTLLMESNGGRTIFHDYAFNKGGTVHMALGWASLYNHNGENNAHWKVDNDTQSIEIRARKDIEAGEEITILYVNDESLLWFAKAD